MDVGLCVLKHILIRLFKVRYINVGSKYYILPELFGIILF